MNIVTVNLPKKYETNLAWDPRSDDSAEPTEGGTRSHGSTSDGRRKQLRSEDVDNGECATDGTFSDQKHRLMGKKVFFKSLPGASNKSQIMHPSDQTEI